MVATGLMALAMTACTARTLPPSVSAAPAATPAPASASPATPTPSVQQATATPPSATEGSEAKDLVGLGPDELQHLFGHPQLVRNETGAEVWQYRAQACVLDLYLYPQESAGMPLRVTYLEARDRSAASLATAPCVSALMTEKRISSL